jgi:hypothetical protein
VSENKAYFVVLLTKNDTKSKTEGFEYAVFTSDFEELSNGKYELPYPSLECDLDQHHLSNIGDYFISYKVYETDAKNKVKDRSLLKKYVIRRINDYDIEEYVINPKKGSVRHVNFQSNDQGLLTLTGLWGPKSEKVSGVFNMIVDFKSKNVTFEEFKEFDKKFILEAWSAKAKEKFENKEAKGKIEHQEPVLVNYKIRDLVRQKDGSTIVLLEQSTIEVKDRTTSSGLVYTYYYHENGIIAYKILTDGTIDWTTYIHKEHVTKDDDGFAISFGYVFNNDQLMLFFNDNLKNYSENGKYINERYKSDFNKKNYCFAQASIDLKTGDVTRSVLLDYKTAGGYILPRYTARHNDSSQGVMIMLKNFSTTRKYGAVSL